MFRAADLGSISNRMGLNPERSYWVRSAFATNRSAAASLRRGGIFLRRRAFIVIDLLLVHVPGADRPDERPAVDRPQHEHQEDVATCSGFPDRAQAPLPGMRIGHDGRHARENRLDFFAGHAVLSALRPV